MTSMTATSLTNMKHIIKKRKMHQCALNEKNVFLFTICSILKKDKNANSHHHTHTLKFNDKTNEIVGR